MKTLFYVLVVGFFFMAGCASKEEHFITDSSYRERIRLQFEETRSFASSRDSALFDVYDTILTIRDKEAMQFLFASMPLSDLADYDGDFFYQHMRMSFKAKEEMAWGNLIPEDVFRHFVLPYRVNNENLDSFRWAMYPELKERVKDLGMKEAAMEVNHWCQERVQYMGADSRTSSPLATIKNGRGRCGEESTLLVAALRTVGIPARQVYTPRWAHCDDNHAWVEIWADGSWYFTGACEPAAHLNQGWFVEPARRAMLIHTKTFGPYQGTEEVLEDEKRYANLNVLEKYAKVKTLRITVLDENGNPVEGAKIAFGLYNYAEFYPLFRATSQIEKSVSFTTGYGDLALWVSKDSLYAFQRISAEESGDIDVVLKRKIREEYAEQIDFIPPPALEPLQQDTANAFLCSVKISSGDSLRNLQKIENRQFNGALLIEFFSDSQIPYVEAILNRAEANVSEVYDFIRTAYESGINSEKIIRFLATFNDKDLRDTPSSIFSDHLMDLLPMNEAEREMFYRYISNPRVSNEMLCAYRSYLRNSFSLDFIRQIKSNPSILIAWVRDSIQVAEDRQQYNVLATPIGVYELRKSDRNSRNVFLVAFARSVSIPARLSETYLQPQFFYQEEWRDVNWEEGCLKPGFTYGLNVNLMAGPVEKPVYRTHFSLGRWENGEFETVEYDFDLPFSSLPQPYRLDPGYYRLITGNRVKDGVVLSNISYFNLNEDRTVELNIREDNRIGEVLGGILLDEQIKRLPDGEEKTFKELLSKEKSIVVWLNPFQEPSRHLIAEIQQSAIVLKEKNLPVFCFTSPNAAFDELSKSFQKIENLQYFEYEEAQSIPFILDETKVNPGMEKAWPKLLLVNDQGEVLYFASGYRIKMLESLLQEIR
jgi:hypothetical protein